MGGGGGAPYPHPPTRPGHAQGACVRVWIGIGLIDSGFIRCAALEAAHECPSPMEIKARQGRGRTILSH